MLRNYAVLQEIGCTRYEGQLSAERSLLVVVDVQEAFVGHIVGMEQVIEKSRLMIEGAKVLGLPIIVTEQYPIGLGRTVEKLREVLRDCRYYEKITFSCCGDEAIREAINGSGQEQVILVGIEAHVCVAQTAYDLSAMGLRPYVAADAVSSRREMDRDIALERLRGLAVVVSTVEAMLFEMMDSSKHKAFREISKLVR